MIRLFRSFCLIPSSALCCLCFVFLLSGCTSPRIEHTLRDKPIGTSYELSNVYTGEVLPVGLDRVAVFPLLGVDGDFAEAEIQQAMVSALRAQARFEIVLVGREEVERESSSGIARISREPGLAPWMVGLAGRYGVDAILQMEMTHYRPYKPLQLGVRARLVHLNELGDILWSVDELFDSGDKTVAIGARKYAEEFVDQPFPLQSSFSVLMSPSRYAAYVGAAVFETLPARPE